MKLFAQHNEEILADGSVRITMQAVTPEYVERQMQILLAFQKTHYDINPVLDIVQQVKSQEECMATLQRQLGISAVQAEGIVNMTLEDMMRYRNSDNFARDLDWLTVLKSLVSA